MCVAFGADDFARDDRARLEVTLLRRRLQDAGLVELGVGVSDDGRGWSLAVQTNDDERDGRGTERLPGGFRVQPMTQRPAPVCSSTI